jgi:uncharacterized protein
LSKAGVYSLPFSFVRCLITDGQIFPSHGTERKSVLMTSSSIAAEQAVSVGRMVKSVAVSIGTMALCGWSLGAVAQVATKPQPPLRTIALNAGLHVIQAEVASTDQTRAIGLMFRKSMEVNRGMLFVFTMRAPHCMWMKNTFIPLSVAFIDEDGKILNVADMTPHDETSHCAVGPARYVLEMNRDWFAARGIKVGVRIGGLEKVPAPR